uniref:Uncharacterized protein n=1 Tax=Anguilla anguilla TaxID=7936 RepID=A0A0E9U4A6_ANGAN
MDLNFEVAGLIPR